MLDSLKGADILITGGGAGMIGNTIAHLAVQNGARVTVLDAMIPPMAVIYSIKRHP